MENTNSTNLPQRYRTLMGRFATGVGVLLARHGGAVVGLTVNSLTSVSLEPLLLLACTRRDSVSAARLIQAGDFTVNVLTAQQQAVSHHFASPIKGEAPFAFAHGERHVWLPDSSAVFQCRLAHIHDGGDHHILVSEVLDVLGPECTPQPLLYHGGRYAQLA